MMDRRDFIKTSAAVAGLAWLGDWEKAFAIGRQDKNVGKAWKGWKKGHRSVCRESPQYSERIYFWLSI